MKNINELSSKDLQNINGGDVTGAMSLVFGIWVFCYELGKD